MKKARFIASAKPSQHQVRVRKKIYVYSRVRKRTWNDDEHPLNFIRVIAKITLQRVKDIFSHKPPIV